MSETRRTGRRVGYRTPAQLELYPILERLYLDGYGTRAAHRIVREWGYTCSTQTVWTRWREFKLKHGENARAVPE